jgi:hypothetical protein
MQGLGGNGETSHTAQRTTAHHSLPRLATVGLLHSGTGSHPRHHLKNARRFGPHGGNQAKAAGRDVSLERVRGDRPQADHISR